MPFKDNAKANENGRKNYAKRKLIPTMHGKRRASWLSYYERNRDVMKPRMQARKYGLTVEQVEAMRVAQEGRCAVCFKVKPLQIDHDHVTGKVRALLCALCNTSVGYAERPNHAMIMVYLARYST